VGVRRGPEGSGGLPGVLGPQIFKNGTNFSLFWTKKVSHGGPKRTPQRGSKTDPLGGSQSDPPAGSEMGSQPDPPGGSKVTPNWGPKRTPKGSRNPPKRDLPPFK